MDTNNFKAEWKDEPEQRLASSDDPERQAILNKLAAGMPSFEHMQGMAYSLAYSTGIVAPGPDDPADAVQKLYHQLPQATQDALMRIVRQIGLGTSFMMVMNGNLHLADDVEARKIRGLSASVNEYRRLLLEVHASNPTWDCLSAEKIITMVESSAPAQPSDERHRSFLHSMETLKEHWPQEVRRLKSYVAYLRGKISALESGRIGGPVQSAKIECRRKDV